MNEFAKQDGALDNAEKMMLNERMNKVVQILEHLGYYEVPFTAAGSEPVQIED